jgi:hypothetical protein
MAFRLKSGFCDPVFHPFFCDVSGRHKQTFGHQGATGCPAESATAEYRYAKVSCQEIAILLVFVLYAENSYPKSALL